MDKTNESNSQEDEAKDELKQKADFDQIDFEDIEQSIKDMLADSEGMCNKKELLFAIRNLGMEIPNTELKSIERNINEAIPNDDNFQASDVIDHFKQNSSIFDL
ncbi:MAG: hypothetical protein MHMPM18_003296 [Marteilia pararefringens]